MQTTHIFVLVYPGLNEGAFTGRNTTVRDATGEHTTERVQRLKRPGTTRMIKVTLTLLKHF